MAGAVPRLWRWGWRGQAEAVRAVGVVALAVAVAFALAGCAAPRFDVPRPVSLARPDGSTTPLGQAFAERVARHPGQSGFRLRASGQDAFVSRAASADQAVRTLDLQYYSVGDDLTTDLLLDRLAAAAARGVRVRILLDDVHPSARQFARQAQALHPGIQVRLFNPFLSVGTSTWLRVREFALDGERLNRRMHNKLWVADNAVAIFGSRNLGDEYFGTSAVANFVDIDLLAVGPVVQAMSQAFDAYWNSSAAWPAEAFVPRDADADAASRAQAGLRERLARCHAVPPCHWLAGNGTTAFERPAQPSLHWGPASLHYDPPERAKLEVTAGIAHAPHPSLGAAPDRGELLIVSPYVIPDEDGLDHLESMAEAGYRIAMLTNSLASTDSVAAHAGYARHRRALLEQQVELYEIQPAPGARHRGPHRWGRVSPGSLHAKFVVQDRRVVVVGSRNQDPRSRVHNTESWVAVHSPGLAAELADLFDEGTALHHAFKVELGDDGQLRWLVENEAGAVQRLDAEPRAGFWLRMWRGVLSLMLPEHLL